MLVCGIEGVWMGIVRPCPLGTRPQRYCNPASIVERVSSITEVEKKLDGNHRSVAEDTVDVD